MGCSCCDDDCACCAPTPPLGALTGTPASSSCCASASQPVRAEPKIARNAPCPCGSGKKYKRCCGG